MPTTAHFRFRAGGTWTDVAVGAGSYRLLESRLPRIAPGNWLVVTSLPVFERTGQALLAGAGSARIDPEPLLVPDGERAKSWSVLGRLLSEMVRRGLRRDGGIVALGGGTVGDVAGLAASLALRGVPVVQVPTTLLAASDSALGGKTAVDLPGGKNLAGTLHHPRLILVEPGILASLSPRAYRAGLAEVVKCSMLDAAFDRRLARSEEALLARDPEAISKAVLASLKLKARVVTADPTETKGLRFVLNLGHTVGHALETASGHRFLHGEAVGWGLLAMLVLSVRRTGLSPAAAERLRGRTLRLVRPPHPRGGLPPEWPACLAVDKKADKGGLRAILLRAPGKALVVRTEPEELRTALDEAWQRYNTD